MSTITTTDTVTTEPVTTDPVTTDPVTTGPDDYTVNTFPGPPGVGDLPFLDLADFPDFDTWAAGYTDCLDRQPVGLMKVNDWTGQVDKGVGRDGQPCFTWTAALPATGGEPSVTQAPRNDLPSTGPETAGVLAGVGLALVVIGVAARRTATRRPATPASGR